MARDPSDIPQPARAPDVIPPPDVFPARLDGPTVLEKDTGDTRLEDTGETLLQEVFEQCDECECLEACCLPDDTCEDLTEKDCRARGGDPQGKGTECATTECGEPATEACCLPDGSCVDALPGDCVGIGGTSQGPGTTCGSVTCNGTEDQLCDRCIECNRGPFEITAPSLRIDCPSGEGCQIGGGVRKGPVFECGGDVDFTEFCPFDFDTCDGGPGCCCFQCGGSEPHYQWINNIEVDCAIGLPPASEFGRVWHASVFVGVTECGTGGSTADVQYRGPNAICPSGRYTFHEAFTFDDCRATSFGVMYVQEPAP
jgi:hypothetical protein